MITFDNTLTINRPVEEVFAALTDLPRIPDWNHYVREVVQVTPGPLRPGNVFHQIRRHDQQRFQILHLDPSRRLVLETLPGQQPAFRRELTLEPDTCGADGHATTRLTDRWQLDTGGASLAQRLGRLTIRHAVNDNLHKLAELLETGTTRLQDGRTVQWNSRYRHNPASRHRTDEALTERQRSAPLPTPDRGFGRTDGPSAAE